MSDELIRKADAIQAVKDEIAYAYTIYRKTKERLVFKLSDIEIIYPTVIKGLRSLPTIDAVPVVRCEDCVWGSPFLDEDNGKTVIRCRMLSKIVMPGDGFCCFGHRGMGADAVERCKI